VESAGQGVEMVRRCSDALWPALRRRRQLALPCLLLPTALIARCASCERRRDVIGALRLRKGKSSIGNYKILANCLILIDLMCCSMRIWGLHKIGGPILSNQSHTRRNGPGEFLPISSTICEDSSITCPFNSSKG